MCIQSVLGDNRICNISQVLCQWFLLCYSLVFIKTLRPRQNGHHFADDILWYISLNGNALISIKIPMTFVPKDPITTFPALFQIMAWRRTDDKPLYEPMLINLPTLSEYRLRIVCWLYRVLCLSWDNSESTPERVCYKTKHMNSEHNCSGLQACQNALLSVIWGVFDKIKRLFCWLNAHSR